MVSLIMQHREEHCGLAKLNNNGKCIACCIHRSQHGDCIGNNGATFELEDNDHIRGRRFDLFKKE